MRSFLVSLVISTLALAGCNGDKAGGGKTTGCVGNKDCKSGYICQSGACIQLCLTQRDCPSGEVCTPQGICDAPATGALPVIEGVVGNDPASDNHIVDGMVLSGLVLGSAVFELQTDTEAIPLTIRSQSETSAELVFPEDILSGEYTLVATNGAGSDQAPVTLTLPELDGDEILTRLNGVTGGELSFDLMPVGYAAGTVAPGNHGHDGDYYPRGVADSTFAPAADFVTTQTLAQDNRAALTSHNLIPNADLSRGLSEWTVTLGNDVVLVDVSGSGPFGNNALANVTPASDPTWLTSDTWLPVDPNGSYWVKGGFRLTDDTDPTGSVYLAVRLQDAAGDEIPAPGRWWFYAVDNFAPADMHWHAFTVPFGAGTAQPFPVDARMMTVGVIVNADPSNIVAAGNRTFEVQGLAISNQAWEKGTDGVLSHPGYAMSKAPFFIYRRANGTGAEYFLTWTEDVRVDNDMVEKQANLSDFVLKRPGWYRINVALLINSIDVNTVYRVQTYKNGAFYRHLDRFGIDDAPSDLYHYVNDTSYIRSDGDDLLSVWVESDSGDSMPVYTGTGYNQIIIEYMGAH